MKTIVNFSVAFENEYTEKSVAIRNVNILKDVMGSYFLMGMSVRFHYRYIRVANVTLNDKPVFALVENRNFDDV